jgi:hypothetical protein
MFKSTFFRFFTAAAFALLSLPVFATSSGTFSPEAVNQLITLTAGAQVSVTLNDSFSADDVSVGNSIDFFVRSNVTINGKVVIAAGATATGWIKSVKKSCEGKCSEITLTVESAQAVDGQTVNLRSIPHVIKVPCCEGTATAGIGANVTARVLNDIKINA